MSKKNKLIEAYGNYSNDIGEKMGSQEITKRVEHMFKSDLQAFNREYDSMVEMGYIKKEELY